MATAALRILALFALLLSLTLAAAPSADASAGAFIKAYGWGVVDGMSQFETCTSTCQAGIVGGGGGQFYQPDGVATDPSGDVYVADEYNNRIDEFSAAGALSPVSPASPVNTTRPKVNRQREGGRDVELLTGQLEEQPDDIRLSVVPRRNVAGRVHQLDLPARNAG